LILLALAAVVTALGGGDGRRIVEDAAASPQSQAVSIVWGGDIALSAAGPLPADGRAGLGALTRPLLATDLALVNLEGTLGTSGTAKCGGAAGGSCFAFQAPPDVARQLAYAGVDAVNRANNHSFDAGEAGLQETTDALDASEMAWTGLTGTVREVNVAGERAALVGFAPYEWADDLRDLGVVQERVRQAAGTAPLVIAMLHAGREGQDATTTPQGREVSFGEDRGDTRGAAHAAFDAGADLVLGSGPHVVRGIELYKNRLIVYSTGNLVGNDTLSLAGSFALSALVRVRLMPDGRPLSGRVLPLVLQPPGTPVRDPERRALEVMDTAGAQDFGAAAVRIARDGVLRLPAAG
jgi:poly-gamma-glutamate capsule biosynthesis protein CapA/YwtB (metallophosphatase superfamily)